MHRLTCSPKTGPHRMLVVWAMKEEQEDCTPTNFEVCSYYIPAASFDYYLRGNLQSGKARNLACCVFDSLLYADIHERFKVYFSDGIRIEPAEATDEIDLWTCRINCIRI